MTPGQRKNKEPAIAQVPLHIQNESSTINVKHTHPEKPLESPLSAPHQFHPLKRDFRSQSRIQDNGKKEMH
jgi:hypothetical protein